MGVEAGCVAYIRTVKTSSGATAVQIVWGSHQGSREIEHLGSAHSLEEVELLQAAGRQRIRAGQDELPFGMTPKREPEALMITGSRMGRLLDAIAHGYRHLGLDRATGGDLAFEQLVTARIIEPTSKHDVGRVLAEAGMRALSYRTIKRRLPTYSTLQWRQRLSTALSARAGLGSASLVLYDVTTLWFETDTGDGFREPGFSKERRLEPQIIVGLLTDTSGAPLMIESFEGNKAETHTMIPVIRSFVDTYQVTNVTVVADAGVLSEANLKHIEDTGWSFIIGGKLPDLPWAVSEWQRTHPGETPPDGLVVSQPMFMGVKADLRRRMCHYHYQGDRARRTLRGIDLQITKAEKAVSGQAPVKRNRFIALSGGTKKVNRELEAKARALAGWKAYVTNLDASAEYVISCYHQLWHVEHSFRMSKHDLKARPIFHHTRESIDAHLAIVFAVLAVSHWIEHTTGWTIKRFVRTFRRYRQVSINTGTQHILAEDPLPEEERSTLARIHDQGVH